jgi:probable rRNA maturation factor
MTKINFFFEEIHRFDINRKILKEVIILIATNEKYVCNKINIVFCRDDYLYQLNLKFLNHDYYTDVVTFDYSDKKAISGEIYISIDRVKENAEVFDQLWENEIARVIFHGVLHLTGYKDKSKEQKRIMRSKEDYYLSIFELKK